MRFFGGKDAGDPSASAVSPSSSPAHSPSVTGPARPIRFVYCDENGKFRLDPQALAVLQLVKVPIGVVAVCGRARQGKSFILNQGTYSAQIFSLAVLLSSLFIYNQMGGIDEASLDRLSLVTEMTKHIRVRASRGRTGASELGQFSPIFVWLLRDFYLDLVEDNKKITPRDYLEIALRPVQGNGKDIAAKNEIRESIRALFPDRDCFTLVRPLNSETELQQLDQTPLDKLRPEFRSGLDALTRFVFERTRPKQVGATIMNGPMLAGITQLFLDALNNGAVPTIASCWQSVEETECRKAYDSATEEYVYSLDKSRPPEEAPLREAHEAAVQKALATFNVNAVGAGSARQRYDKLLQNFVKRTFEREARYAKSERNPIPHFPFYVLVSPHGMHPTMSDASECFVFNPSDYKRNAYMEADLHCSNVIQSMERRLRAACHASDAKLHQALKFIDSLLSEYEASCHGPGKDRKKAIFLQQSFEGPISDLAKKLMDQIESENSALALKCQSIEDKMALLSKQLEASERQKSEYLKRYEAAVNDKRKIADDYMSHITIIESKCSSVEVRYSSLSKALDSAKEESLEWKRKYEQILSKQKAGEDEACAEIAVLKSRSSAAEASLAAIREQALSAQEEAEEWKRKYEVTVREAKYALEKAALVQVHANKNVQLREDALRSEFARTLVVKEKELKDRLAKIYHAEQQLATLKLGLKAAESNIKNYDTEIAELKLEIKVLAEKLEVANAGAVKYEREAKVLEQEKIHLEEKYRSQFARFDELHERCTAAEKEARRASEIADKAQAEAANTLKENSDIQRISMERVARIEKAERLIENLERQKKDLAEEVESLRKSEVDAKAKMASLEDRIKEREQEIESLMKSNNEQRADTVQALEGLLETERNVRAEASRRAEALSLKLQATQHKLDLVQQELTSVRLNESALGAKLKTALHGKHLRIDDHEMGVDSVGDVDLNDKIAQGRKKFKCTGGLFPPGSSPEDGGSVFKAAEEDQLTNSGDYTKFTVQQLKQELVKHDFGAELLRLANPSKKQVLALYERCVLQKS
ncbi:hypothetical protein Cgig2_005215 [Carnegiea gigantea]|uniref:GB1/RHD3-type G domain-containing protein n=1 Tax=Carnegiea gigantea TaxID=171969 RepID=A0A9Q1JV99_9CARY|nr:hypothetical protein Cgig2_005215 [Carnegiea gigantea]